MLPFVDNETRTWHSALSRQAYSAQWSYPLVFKVLLSPFPGIPGVSPGLPKSIRALRLDSDPS